MARAALPLLLSVCLAPAKAYSAPTVKLLTFDGEPDTKHDVQNMDDPVMVNTSFPKKNVLVREPIDQDYSPFLDEFLCK